MIFLDSFSGHAADLKKGQRTPENVLAVLAKHPRVSTWDMSENAWLRDCIGTLKERGAIVDETAKEVYPWHRFRVVSKEAS